MHARSSRALVRYRRQGHGGLKLLCFPYAGGAAAVYREWPAALSTHFDVVAVEYPGRGARRHEQLVRCVPELVDGLMPEIVAEMTGPFAVFGHSMGGLVAYEVLRVLSRRGIQPVCAIMSGCRPPAVSKSERRLHELADAEFIDELRKLDGTPEEILADTELMAIALPVLRADFEAVASYVPSVEPRLSCPIFAYGGLEDQGVNVSELEHWKMTTGGPCTVRAFPGAHFFLHTEIRTVLRILLRDILEACRAGGSE